MSFGSLGIIGGGGAGGGGAVDPYSDEVARNFYTLAGATNLWIPGQETTTRQEEGVSYVEAMGDLIGDISWVQSTPGSQPSLVKIAGRSALEIPVDEPTRLLISGAPVGGISGISVFFVARRTASEGGGHWSLMRGAVDAVSGFVPFINGSTLRPGLITRQLSSDSTNTMYAGTAVDEDEVLHLYFSCNYLTGEKVIRAGGAEIGSGDAGYSGDFGGFGENSYLGRDANANPWGGEMWDTVMWLGPPPSIEIIEMVEQFATARFSAVDFGVTHFGAPVTHLGQLVTHSSGG